MDIHKILKEYWGHNAFRPLQENIIQGFLDGRDVIALLPTGGGKSVCFQVPALCLDGICLVISPLVALMKDQVERLQSMGIQAAALYSGLHPAENSLIINNAIHGGLKFLYLSPERLDSAHFRDYLAQMKISMLAVDEAHCISQWGFDFRPEYRKIAAIRELFPHVRMMALTASATQKVVEDIGLQLEMKNPLVFRKSFERKNLHYVVRYLENKLEKVKQVYSQNKGSGLVYVRSRKMCELIAAALVNAGINAASYHAGLPSDLRKARQEQWINGEIRIMVCTNAFGMGIDKPDCRIVVHYEIPDSLEAYYQEAGRAGRDEKNAYCLLLYHPSDAVTAISRFEQNFPDAELLRKVYDGICRFLQIPEGNIPAEEFAINWIEFADWLKVHPVSVMNAAKMLADFGTIKIREGTDLPSRLRIIMPGNQLYAFRVENAAFDNLIKMLLRMYGGILDHEVFVNEKNLGIQLNISLVEVKQILQKLDMQGVVQYTASSELPGVTLLHERIKADFLKIPLKELTKRKENERAKLDAVIHYASNNLICRSRLLLQYFDENKIENCGECDVCKEQIPKQWTEDRLQQFLLQLSQINELDSKVFRLLIPMIKGFNEKDCITGFRILLDKGILRLNIDEKLCWNGPKESYLQ